MTSEMELMLKDYRLTTAEILYHLPDFPKLLQSYVWQEYDIAPRFPALKSFLDFWEREIEGRLHSVKICSSQLIRPAELTYTTAQFQLH